MRLLRSLFVVEDLNIDIHIYKYIQIYIDIHRYISAKDLVMKLQYIKYIVNIILKIWLYNYNIIIINKMQ